MEFYDYFELIHFDFILEGLGLIFACAFLWNIFLGENVQQIFQLFILSIC